MGGVGPENFNVGQEKKGVGSVGQNLRKGGMILRCFINKDY